MKKIVALMVLISLFTFSNVYAGGCNVQVRRANVGYNNNNINYNNGFNGYNNNVAYQNTVVQLVPTIVLPVLTSHGNLVTAQPYVLEQTIAQIDPSIYANYGGVTTFLVPQVTRQVVTTNKANNVQNTTTVVDTQNQGLFNGGVLQRISNAIANRGKTTVVQNADNSQTIVRQRLIGGTTVETVPGN